MEKEAKKWIQEQQAKYPKVPGVEYDTNVRWEKGIPHHPKSISLFKKIENLDFLFQNDFFCFKSGGDGDNGEFLMYLMDIAFEEQDAKIKSGLDEVGIW